MPDPFPSTPLEAPRPEGVQATRDGDGLTLSYRWFTPLHLVMLLFAVFWNAFLVFWYGAVFSAHQPASSPALWFPLLHVAAGIGIAYFAVAGLLNRTVVRVVQGTIVVRSGPLPWIGNRIVQAAEVRQLYRERTFATSRGGTIASYHLCAVLSGNRKLRLIRAVGAADIALYFEQEIEKALGITDRPVPGEMPK
jgi:hypothetical protein